MRMHLTRQAGRFGMGLVLLSLILAACQPNAAVPAAATNQPQPNQAQPSQAAAIPVAGANGVIPDFAAAFQSMLLACANTGIDQACYGAGQVQATTRAGEPAGEFRQPGDLIDLAGLDGLQVRSPAGEWSLALVRLQADLDPEQSVNLVLMGDTQITDLHVDVADAFFTPTILSRDLPAGSSTAVPQSQAGIDPWSLPASGLPGGGATPPPPLARQNDVQADDLPPVAQVDPLQRLRFSSEPNPAGQVEPLNGLLISTQTGGAVASLSINSASFHLGSTAFVQAQPGAEMTVAMSAGSVLVETGDSLAYAVPGTQVALPLDGAGQVTAPVDPRADAISKAVAQYGEPVAALDPRAQAIADAVAQYGIIPVDPRADAISKAVAQYYANDPVDPRVEAVADAVAQYPQSVVNYYQQKFNRAVNRCVNAAQPDTRAAYVYHVMYWYNLAVLLNQDADFRAAMGPDYLTRMQTDSQRCLRFELDFNSRVEVRTQNLSYTVHLKSEGIKVRFSADGSLVQMDQQPLRHLEYTVQGGETVCPRTLNYPDGALRVTDGNLNIYQERMEVTVVLWPDAPFEEMVYNCPTGSIPVTLSWAPLFYFMNQDMVQGSAYQVQDWEYVGRELFAEAIFEGNRMPIADGEAVMTTFMVLAHTPQ